MNVYEISTGRWFAHDGTLVGVFHAGTDLDGDGQKDPGEGHNDPAMVGVRNVGPIPPGIYRISSPFDHPRAGPYTLRLEPLQPERMLGRSGFLLHGGGAKASEGCIVAPPDKRRGIWTSGDHWLVVLAEIPPRATEAVPT